MDERSFFKLLGPLTRRVGAMLSRGTVKGSNSSGRIQTLQLSGLAGLPKDGAEHFEPYGFTSRPLLGAEYLQASLVGDGSHTVVVVATDRRHRIANLKPGEVAIFTDEGDSIVLKRGRLIEVTTHTLRINAQTNVEINTDLLQVTATTKAIFTTPLVETSANLTVGGILSALNGYSLGGVLAVGVASKITGSITLDGVTLNAINGSTSTWNGKRNDDTHTHPIPGGNSGTPN